MIHVVLSVCLFVILCVSHFNLVKIIQNKPLYTASSNFAHKLTMRVGTILDEMSKVKVSIVKY